MAQHLLELDPRGVVHARQVLAEYLPQFDAGLLPLSDRRALIPDTTLLALEHQYGRAGLRAILHRAGVDRRESIDDADALQALAARDRSQLPARTEAPASQRLWHLDAVGAPAAWAHWGGPDTIAWGAVRVGQIDTGYTAHPSLGFPGSTWVDTAAGRTIFAPGQGDGGPGPGGGIDPLEGSMDGHGMRVASVIAGADPAAAGGTYWGGAPRVPLVPVRIANHVLISHAQRELAQALDYLVQVAQVSVINLSMGFLPRWQIGALDRAIDRAYEAGVILVCAAGQPLASVVSPAHGRRTIAVAGSTRAGTPWSNSAHGSAVDWTAPASEIHRARAESGAPGGYQGGADGTSYAAALSTAAAALWLARQGPAIDAQYPQRWQRVEAFRRAARETARPMPHQAPGSFGTGILRIDELLQAPLPAAGTLQPEAPA
jgi:hypothetical protein